MCHLLCFCPSPVCIWSQHICPCLLQEGEWQWSVSGPASDWHCSQWPGSWGCCDASPALWRPLQATPQGESRQGVWGGEGGAGWGERSREGCDQRLERQLGASCGEL
jgi:hypothetical protein